jgi:hypothetical protein
MNTHTDTTTARETDEALAALFGRLYIVMDKQASNDAWLKRLAGAKFYYRGRQRVTDMKLGEAMDIVTAAVAELHDWRETHREPASESGYVGTDWKGYAGKLAPHEQDHAERALESHRKLDHERNDLHEKIAALEATYTGWSRFFLVTSSAGHVHSSMHCSTCRPTTRYGWLPALSGQDEPTAVAELGPTLCTVCFPSAPLDWTTGKKLTAAQAAKRAA